jgi:hypothetical protein
MGQINEKNINQVKEYINKEFPNIENFNYTIREDGKIIKFTADNILKHHTENLSKKSLESIKYIEKTLKVKYKGITDINNRIYFNFRT